jgi:hypothetical protein
MIVTLCLFVVSKTEAQTSFDKYMTMTDVTAVQATPEMFELMSDLDLDEMSEGEDEKSMLTLLKNVEEVMVISSENNARSTLMQQDFQSYVDGKKLNKLMSVNKNGSQFLMYQKSAKSDSDISKFALYMHDENNKNQSLILIINGEMDKESIEMIRKTFDVPAKSDTLQVRN